MQVYNKEAGRTQTQEEAPLILGTPAMPSYICPACDAKLNLPDAPNDGDVNCPKCGKLMAEAPEELALRNRRWLAIPVLALGLLAAFGGRYIGGWFRDKEKQPAPVVATVQQQER